MLLKIGNSGLNVKYLQYGLRIMCIDIGNVDGIFGDKTFNGVKLFQSNCGLAVDGIVGDNTWNELKCKIKKIQLALNNYGYSLTVDGVAGSKTYDAVIEFQKSKGLSTDGMVGPNTKSKLFNSKLDNRGSSSSIGGVSNACVDFIKTYEGFYSRPYRDIGGVLTIGYGSTHGWIMKKSYVTKEEGTTALKEEIDNCARQIKNNLNSRGVSLNQHQFDALCSFAYNCGVYALFNSTLYRRICEGVRDSSLKENFEAYNKVNGKFSRGLWNRRVDEYEMFMYGDYKRNH